MNPPFDKPIVKMRIRVADLPEKVTSALVEDHRISAADTLHEGILEAGTPREEWRVTPVLCVGVD